MASNYKTGASLNLTSFEMQLLSRSPCFEARANRNWGDAVLSWGGGTQL